MGEFSISHILLLLVIFLIFFGPKKLPELGKSLGESIRGFKKAMSGEAEQKQNTQQIAQEKDPTQESKNYSSSEVNKDKTPKS